MRKIKIIALAAAMLISIFIFSGCANKILYGSWQLKETIDTKTNQSEESMFGGMMTFTINKDGTVMLMDSLFGTYEKNGNEFIFTYDLDEGEETETVSGAWELIGTDLYIYDDTSPYIYHLVAVTKYDE